jgi:hypothetical protein
MADFNIKSPIQSKPVSLEAYGAFYPNPLKDEPGKIGSLPLGSERNVNCIDEMTLDDYRRGMRVLIEECRLRSWT